MSGREQYPNAPRVSKGTVNHQATEQALERRRWMEKRNAAIQGGVWDESREKGWERREVGPLRGLKKKRDR